VSDVPEEKVGGVTEVSEKTCLLMMEELSFFPFMEEKDFVDVPCYFKRRLVKAGDVLFREGDTCDDLAYIIAGRLEIKKATDFQGKEFILGIYGRGSLVGELCFLDSSPRPYTAVALEECSLVELSKENFDTMVAEVPELGIKFLKGLLLAASIRLRKSFDRMAAIF
jgi:CRP/FNR family cyclic AMP-dependent transcriptional regulator